MKFSPDEVALAHELKAAGMPWTPTVGHYVWDRNELIQHASPFHGRVYFILELKHFLRRCRSMDHLTASMVWLPTWEQAREILRDRGIDDDQVADHLNATNALRSHTERTQLYRLILRTFAEA